MPRTLQEILDQQNELAAQIEAYEPAPEDERDSALFTALLQAAQSRGKAETVAAVAAARAGKYSWTTIGTALGTSGEAARKRYGALITS